MRSNQTAVAVHPGPYIKPEKPGPAPPRQDTSQRALPCSLPGEQACSTMMSPHALPCLLLLPLGACLPLLDSEEPAATVGGVRSGMSWADLPGGHRMPPPRSPPGWPKAPQPHGLLVTAKELQVSGQRRPGFTFRLGRQDDGSEATGFLPADGEKASGPLGTLAEELSSYSRKKGGFSFRFGRR